jgi:hypothetical protein
MKSRSKGSNPLDNGIPNQKRSVNPIFGRDEAAIDHDRPIQKKTQTKFQQKINKQPVLLRPHLISSNTKIVDGRVSSSPHYVDYNSNSYKPTPLTSAGGIAPNGFFVDQRRPMVIPIPQRPVSSVSGSSDFGSGGNLSTGGQELYITDHDDFVSGNFV